MRIAICLTLLLSSAFLNTDDLVITPPSDTIPAVPAGAKQITSCATIKKSGPYVLSNNLTAASDCLVIAADFVELNLNGFTVTRHGASGSNKAITDGGSGRARITVRNGALRGFHDGVDLRASQGVVVQNVQIVAMGAIGDPGYPLIVGDGSTVSDNLIYGNIAKTSLEAGVSCIIARNVVRDSSGIGIAAGEGGLVSDNVIRNISEDGINLLGKSTVRNNTISEVSDLGIHVGSHSAVVANTVTASDGAFGSGISVGIASTATGNTVSRFGIGISAGNHSSVTGNTVTLNKDVGISVLNNAMIANNIVAENVDRGIQVSKGTIVVGNHIAGNKTGVSCAGTSDKGPALRNNTFAVNGTNLSNCNDLGGNIGF